MALTYKLNSTVSVTKPISVYSSDLKHELKLKPVSLHISEMSQLLELLQQNCHITAEEIGLYAKI